MSSSGQQEWVAGHMSPGASVEGKGSTVMVGLGLLGDRVW